MCIYICIIGGAVIVLNDPGDRKMLFLIGLFVASLLGALLFWKWFENDGNEARTINTRGYWKNVH
jgi:hypothetical protein